MTLLEWRDEYRIGIDDVDTEHETLIEMINGVCAVVEPGATNAELELALGEIYAVCIAHFATEEREMRARSYPRLVDHREDHERLLVDLRDVMDYVSAYGVLDRDAFAIRLTEWFGVHFRTHDARLHAYLAGLAARGPA